jgi:hypothetical protein
MPDLRGPDPEVLSRLEERIAADVRPVRPRPILTTALGLTAVAAGIAAASLVAVLVTKGASPALGEIALYLPAGLLALAGYYAAVRLATPGAAPPAVVLWAVALGPFALLLGLGAAQGPLHLDLSQCLAGGGMCLGGSLLMALAPAALSLYLLRHSLAASPAITGAAVGAASAMAAALATHLVCRSSECAHLLLLHGGAIALMAAAVGFAWGALARRRGP